MKRRFLSLLTAFALCLTLIPTTAFADDEKRGEDVSPSICETACTEELKLGKEQPNAIAEDEGSSAPADDELGSDVVAAKASPVAMRAANGISARAANGTITLGSTVLDITQSSISSTYDTTGGFKYDADTKTLTLRNCTIDTYTKVSSEQLPGIFNYYNVFLDSRNVGTLNIVLEGSNYIGDSSSLKYMSAASDVNTPRYLGIWGNTVRFSGSGSLTIEAQTFPIQSGGIETSGSVDLTLRSYMNGTVTRSMAVGAGTSVTAETKGNNLDFYALNVKNNLTVNGTLNATTKGCVYQNDYPVALLVGGTLRVVGGQVTATSDGRNGNDGCQGYGIKANVLEIGGGGTVRAYSNGYSMKTNRYDGKEAIYVSSNLTVDLGGYLYAKTQNPILSNENENGALKVNGSWDLSGTNGDTAYTKAVITKPVNGSIYENVILGTTVSPEKEVEISGIRNAVLVLSYYKGQYNEGKTWYYRNADRPGDTDSIKQNVYSSGSTQQELNLKEGFSRVLASDYNNYYGIDVREGEHTVVLDGLAIVRDHTFLTVRSGATLNLKLTGKSYLKSGSAPTIYVEQGGTLNLIGGGMAQSSLALMGGLSAASGATVNFKDCAVYAAGKTIGGTGANVSVENCWISAGFAGNLRVTRSTLEGEHSGGTVKIDRRSNANLTDASGKAVTGVTDHSGNPVYRTKVELEDMNQSRNLMMIAYRTDATSGTMQSTFYPLVTQLRVNIPNTVNDDVIKDLSMLVSDNTVYLWLPNGTRIMSVEGFQDDGSSPVGFIHDPQKDAPIITTADNSASGKMILLSLLLASGVLAFRGTPGGDNTALCAGYLGDSAKDTWIDYYPEKDVKLQADWKFITDFGIRMLTGGEAEVKLNGLDLSGPNKRVELDDRSKLSIVLMENTESVMRSNEGSTDAVWTLKGSGGLTIKGQSGGEKLTLRGDHAMDGSTGASLTFNGITLINNCTNKPETTLGKLTISNSTVLGLGTVNCANIVINGGSVDLDVPVNTVVKDSNGNELKKVTLTLSEKNAAVEDVTLSGLPANAAFDDSHIISDGSGKLYLWIPKDAEVVTVTVGGNKYYPKSDGSMTIGDVPEFTSPTQDVSRVVESNDYMTLTVDVTGTPAPALQWQVSRDGGKTWENIEGATEATYQAILPLSLHGAKFRCAATNKDGTTYSHTFTAYYCPAYLRGAASPMRGNGEFIQGEIATITAGLYDNSTWYPVSSLTGVTAEYRWKYCRNVMPTEEEWAKIPPASESYPITITDEMDYQSVCFHVTLTYPDNTVKTVTGFWRLNVCVTPVVTEQPQSVSAAAGDSVTFSAKLIDQYLNTLEYQWQSSTDGGQNWTDIEGAGGKSTADFWNYTPSYTIPSVTAAQSGQLFRCVLWNTNNHTGSDRVSTPPVYSEPATLTVTPPAHEHSYGDWSKDGTNHWHECTDAACPNRNESITDKATHDYDDDADTTCNICGYVRTVTPEIVPVSQITLNKAETSISVGNSETLTATVAPENATIKALNWASSDEDVATVAPDGTVTAVKAGAATITATAADGSGKSAVCKVTVTGDTTPPAHEHRYGDWSKDGTNHWHECTDADCPERPESIKDKEAHVYDDDADTTCNVCGYVRTVTPPAHEHRYGDWSKDGTNHWHECTDAACPNQSESIKDKAAHIYDDDADTTCNICGYVRTVTPPAHEHRYGDWRKDGTNHWHECTDNDCPNREESIKDKAAHVYDNDADTTCNVCGYVRTVTPEIVPVSQITLNKAETSISVGNSETLTATVAPENATIKALNWASSDEDVATVAPDGTVTAVKAGAATITATAADGSGKSAVCKVTVIGGTTPSQPGGSTGGSSGGSSSGGGGGSSSTTPTKPETATKPDGTKVETVTKPDGTKVETTTGKDGSVTKTETKKDGSSVTENKAADGSTGTVKTDKNGQTEAAAKVSGKAVEDAKKNGEAVKVPVEVEATRNSSTAPTVSIELPKGAGETKVEIPVSNVTPGTVAVLVHPDGTEEILKDSIPTEDGIQLTVDGSATVKIVDNSKGFIDTRNHWAEDEIDFVSARGLVNGMSATIYAPNNSTTRAQLWTILARQNGADLNGGNTWYEKAQNWAKDKGVSDGANHNAAITRAQMVTMLWRAVGQPTAGGTANFTDVPTDSYYAQAVAWAVENGITTGVGNGHFDPTGTCTRAQIAAFLARSMK